MGRGLFFSRITLALTRLPTEGDGQGGGHLAVGPEILFNLTYQNAGRQMEQFPFLAEVNA